MTKGIPFSKTFVEANSTLPMGANPLSTNGFSDSNNIDMSVTCKSNVNKWPDDGRHEKVNGIEGKSWWHSDYKDLPYQFTYKFYEEIVNKIK